MKERKVSGRVFNFTVGLLNEYLKFPSAKNSLYTGSDINQCLIQLSLSQGFAECGLANLSEKCGRQNNVPTGRTFRGRTERLPEGHVRDSLTGANDHVIRILKGYGVFWRKAVVAIDYARPPFYGDPNAMRARSDLYFGFATNIPKSSAAHLPIFIPQEYRRRWGTETGYRMQGNVQAKTTSTNYTLRLLYHMTSILLYNVWHYANLLLCKALKTQFKKPLLKLTSLAVHFENLIICGLEPPRH